MNLNEVIMEKSDKWDSIESFIHDLSRFVDYMKSEYKFLSDSQKNNQQESYWELLERGHKRYFNSLNGVVYENVGTKDLY